MPRGVRTAIVVLLLSLPFAPAPFAHAAEKRLISEKDLFKFQWIGDPQISPDGSRVVFVRVTVDRKKEGYETSLWIVPTHKEEAPEPLTAGAHDSSPRWSPDGRSIVFVRSREKDGKPQLPQLYLLSLTGGEARALTDLPKGANSPLWSPDGRKIAFKSDTTPEDLAKKKDPDSTEEHESDVRVITRAIYRFNGEGYVDPKHHTHIWALDLPKSYDETVTPRQLTSGRFDDDEVLWAKDGSQLYFTSVRVEEPYYEMPETDLYSVSQSGGVAHKLFKFDFDAGSMSLSPDGKKIAFRGSASQPVRSYSQPDLWVMNLAAGSKPRNLTAEYDYDVGSSVGGDQHAPRAGGSDQPLWTADGNTILDLASKEGRVNIVKFDAATGAATEVTQGDHAVSNFTRSADGTTTAYEISTTTRIGDLFILNGDGEPKQITHINDELFSQLRLTEPEEIWYRSFDGKRVQAWVQKPPDFNPHHKYPLILNIHGGPHSAYGFIFDHEMQWMAAKGYVVLYPNPRGSTTYGQDFGNVIQYHYPGDDFKDLMAGVDELIHRGYIDDSRLGVTGGSGGGLLTNWVVTHTDRFKAAVSQRDISDWASWWYTADFTLFQPTWFKAPPFQDAQDYVNRSPITYVQNIHTPMMFILGEADYRTPPTSGGEQIFRALKFLKRPTIMIRFPGESHELSRSGQAWHRVERLEHITGWFDKYLLGKHIAAYDEVDLQQQVSATPEQRKAQDTPKDSESGEKPH